MSRVPGPRQVWKVQRSQTSGFVCAAKEVMTVPFLPHSVRHSGWRGPGHGPREGCGAVCVGSVVSVAAGAPRNPALERVGVGGLQAAAWGQVVHCERNSHPPPPVKSDFSVDFCILGVLWGKACKWTFLLWPYTAGKQAGLGA